MDHTQNSTAISRRFLLGAFAATLVSAAPTFSKAAGFLRRSGDIRSLNMYSKRSGERVNTVYWIDGHYIPEAIDEINRIMRDWRRNEIKQIDLREKIDSLESKVSINLDEKLYSELLSLRNQLKGG